LLDQIRLRAGQSIQRLVFPEGGDVRVVEAASRIAQEGFAAPLLLGDPEQIQATADSRQISLEGVAITNPASAPELEKLAELYYKKRRHRGISREEALERARDPLYFAALLVDEGECDGAVAGAVRSTSDTVRAGIQCVGMAEGIAVVSSFFIMALSDHSIGENGILFYADCGVVPDPTPEQLADIAFSTAENARIYLQNEPRVAFLSFSTHGSAEHPLVEKVQRAYRIFCEKYPHLTADGELQAD